MLFLKRGLMAAGALALAAMLLNLVAPRAAHALVATAVQVMNTSATPVMTRDVDAVGRSGYYLQCSNSAGSSCDTAVVPSGYYFVLDSISFSGHAAGPTGLTVCRMELYTPPLYPSYMVPLVPNADGFSYVTQNLTAYSAGGTFIHLQCGPSPDSVQALFAGHLVSSL